jgi:nucleoid DNA-binding protein
VTKQKKNEPVAGLTEVVGTRADTVTEEVEVIRDEAEALSDAHATETDAVSEMAAPEAQKPGSPQRIGPAEKAFLEVVRDALAEGDSVRLPGLGSLNVRLSAPRVGRNPRTGERIEIPATRRVRFSQSPEMRSLLND